MSRVWLVWSCGFLTWTNAFLIAYLYPKWLGAALFLAMIAGMFWQYAGTLEP